MPFHFESNTDPYDKYRNAGYGAFLNGDQREAPFNDQQSPEAEAWLEGFDAAIESKKKAEAKEIRRQQEILKQKKTNEEIAMLEQMYQIKNE